MNEEDLRQHIDAILVNLNEQHKYGTGQQRPTTDEQETSYQQNSQTIIDVYVIEREAEEPPTIESTLDTRTQGSQDDESQIVSPTPLAALHRTRPNWYILALVALCTLLIGAGASIYLVQLFTSSASVTIVTASRLLTTTSTVELVTNGNVSQTKNQVRGRTLPAITMSQQKTIPTTGMTHQAAQAARGTIIFYNAAPYVQTIEVGTLLIGADGVQIITDQTATIPAAIMPTEGQVSIYAHTAITGEQGNIRAGDIYGACCRLNVFAQNGAFHGGQDARIYQSVTQQDINSVITSVKSSLDQSIQVALQTQIQTSETLITPLTCTSKVTPDHEVGQEAVQIQVTVSETCIGMTYTTQSLTSLVTQIATHDANTRLGTGYTTTAVQSRIVKTLQSNHDTLDLQIQSISLWTYPFSQEQQESIKAMIAGMSKDRATARVLHITGVQSVSIIIKRGTTIPNDVKQIHLLFLQV